MKKDNDYVIKNEDSCDQWFSGFAQTWFDEYGRQAIYQLDWTGKTTDGKQAVMELKGRDYPSTLDSAYIEAYKLKQLENARDYHGKVAYYINHWSDGVISVHRITTQDLREPKVEVKRANNYGYRAETESGKVELWMDDAWLFDGITYKLKRKPIRSVI